MDGYVGCQTRFGPLAISFGSQEPFARLVKPVLNQPDFSKAFDTVPHQRLLSKLQYYGIKGHILSWLKAFLTERTQTVVLDGESSKPSRVTSGVPQGTSPTDAQGLQADLDALTEWQDLHISNDMRWDAHIAHATGKANRTLGVIRRNLCHCTSQVKNTCYKALVRPQLEYCASVWDPYTAGGVQAVERVQRRAARMVMNDYARTSSVTEMLQKLQWPTLANRRREAQWNSLPAQAVQAQSVEAFRASLLDTPHGVGSLGMRTQRYPRDTPRYRLYVQQTQDTRKMGMGHACDAPVPDLGIPTPKLITGPGIAGYN
ncbi:hypothetical protein Bbelb_060820 [Branchiostoma belcheri]|nr:hypothetical protein Bbelb_060820 [Branchiostoma belcheri]